jgi:hypothetical protein
MGTDPDVNAARPARARMKIQPAHEVAKKKAVPQNTREKG